MSEPCLRLAPLTPEHALESRLPLDADTSDDTVAAWIVAAGVFCPWALIAPEGYVALAADAARRVLSGQLAAFGLVGAVVEGQGETDALTSLGLFVEHADDDLAAALARLRERVRAHSPEVPDDWGRVVASARVDPEVRAALARRALADDPGYRPLALSPEQLGLLRRIAARLVPQGDGGAIDLGARADAMLATGEGDGWRPAGAPSDVEAYRRALDALADEWPDDDAGQADVVTRLVAGEVAAGTLEADELSTWFEDMRNDVTRLWLSHPASFARIGYTGFATGGTGPEPAGYRVLAAGEREEWEPADVGRLSAESEEGTA